MFKARVTLSCFISLCLALSLIAQPQTGSATQITSQTEETVRDDFDCTPRPNAYLVGCDYSNQSLSNLDFSGSDLSFANFTDATLFDVNFTDSDIYGSTWQRVKGESWNFTRTKSGGISGGIPKTTNPNLEYNPLFFVNGYLVTNGVDLSGARLGSADLTNLVLRDVDFSSADLRGVNFAGSVLEDIDFRTIDGTNLNFYGARLRNVNFTDADMEYAVIGQPGFTQWTYLDNVNFSFTHLQNTEWSGVDIKNSNFQGANFMNASAESVASRHNSGEPVSHGKNFKIIEGAFVAPKSRIYDVSFVGENLANTDFSEGALIGVDFTDANLSGSNFNKTWISSTVFERANLSKSDFRNSVLDSGLGSNVQRTTFRDANLSRIKSGGISGQAELPDGWQFASGAILGPTADLSGVTLNGSTGLTLSGIDLSKAELFGIRARNFKSGPVGLPEGWIFAAGALIGPGVDLNGLNLGDVDLSQANLFRVKSTYRGLAPLGLPTGWVYSGGLYGPGVNLEFGSPANFHSVDLSNSFVIGADISGYDLRTAVLTDARWQNIYNERTISSNLPAGWKVLNGYLAGPSSDLSDANLAGADLTGVDLSNANLTNVTSGGIKGTPIALPPKWSLVGGFLLGPTANLEYSNFKNLNLGETDLSNARLAGIKSIGISGNPNLPFGWQILNGFLTCQCELLNFSDMNLGSADLSLLELSKTGVLSGRTYGTPVLPDGWKLAKGYLIGPKAMLWAADLSGLDLSNQDFTGADISDVNFTDSNLQNAKFHKVRIDAVNFLRANLSGAEFFEVNIGPNFSLLTRAGNFSYANLSGAKFVDSLLGTPNLSPKNSTFFRSTYVDGFYVSQQSQECDIDLGATSNTSEVIIRNCNLKELKLSQVSAEKVTIQDSRIGRLHFSGVNADTLNIDNSSIRLMNLSGQINQVRVFSNTIYKFEDNNLHISNFELRNSKFGSFSTRDSNIDLLSIADTNFQMFTATDSTIGISNSSAANLPTNWSEVMGYLVGPGVDLSNLDFHGANFDGVDLSGANLENSKFEQALFINSDLSESNLKFTNFSSAKFENVDISNSNLEASQLNLLEFTNVDISNSNFAGTSLSNTSLSNVKGFGFDASIPLPSGWYVRSGFIVGPSANLEGANLLGVNLNGINLGSAKLSKVRSSGIIGTPTALPKDWVLRRGMLLGPSANLSNSQIVSLNLDGLNLESANFSGLASSGLTGSPIALPENWVLKSGRLFGPEANFSRADLSNLDLSGLNLAKSIFSGSNLAGANLSFSNLHQANLSSANLTGVKAVGVVGTPLQLPGGYKFFRSCILGPRLILDTCDLTGLNLDGISLAGSTFIDVRSGLITGTPNSMPNDFELMNGYLVGPGVNLSNADLSNLYFGAINLEGANLTGANFQGSIVTIRGTPSYLPDNWKVTTNSDGLKFLMGPGVRLSDMSLRGTNLSNIDLSGANLDNISSGQITGTPAALPDGWKIAKGFLIGPRASLRLSESEVGDLQNVDLSGMTLSGLKAEGVDLSSSQIINTLIQESNFKESQLRNINFSGTSFIGTDLRDANLTSANLSNARFVDSNLAGAKLVDVNLADAELRDVSLEGVFSSGIRGIPKSLPVGYGIEGGALVKLWGSAMRFTVDPLISGDFSVGSIVQYTGFEFDNNTQLSFQWTLNGKSVPGATTRKYLIRAADFGKNLSLTVTARKLGFETISRLTEPIRLPSPIMKILSLSTTGEYRVGKTVKVSLKTLNNFGVPRFQWLANGKVIKGASASSLLLTKALKSKKISCLVTLEVAGAKSVSKSTSSTLVR